jgi:hypothetical protein
VDNLFPLIKPLDPHEMADRLENRLSYAVEVEDNTTEHEVEEVRVGSHTKKPNCYMFFMFFMCKGKNVINYKLVQIIYVY